MEKLLPFYMVGFGLYCMVRGASGLLPPLRIGREAGPVEAGDADRRVALRNARVDCFFWFVAGVVVLRSVDVRTSWFSAAFGLLASLGGAWGFLSTFRRGGPAAVAGQPAEPIARTWGRTAVRWLGPALLLGLGTAITSFSGIHVGRATTTPRPRDGDGRLVEIVTERVGRAFEEGGRVGLVVGAVADGEAMLQGFGARRVGSPEAPDADTVFEVGSLSKVFTGILLARRIEDGTSKLDDRVADLLPEGWSLPGPARAITLRHCTTHTSGLPRLPGNLMSVSGVFDLLFGGDPYRDYSEEQFREALATVELDREPGVELAYSNFAVGLLGFVLAKQAGSDYERLVRSGICGPLGMADTTTVDDEPTRGRTAAKYRSALTLGPASLALGSDSWRLPNHLAGAGAVRSTGRDMMTFLKANMGLVPTPIDAAIRRSHQELFRESEDRSVGMNWFRSYEPSLSQEVVWHNGGTGGFRTYLGFTADRRFGVFVLSNTAVSVDDMAREILKALVQAYAPESRKLVTKRGYARVAPYTGVRWEAGRPIVQVQGRWRRLASIDGIPIGRILDFARREFGDAARKRLAEDLVELLSKMGHEPRWDVILGLEDDEGEVETLKAPMTEENRDRVRG